jgi:hypothetical protein
MAVPPLLLNQIRDALYAISNARDVLQYTLNLNIGIQNEDLAQANSYVEDTTEIGTIPMETINQQGIHLPDYINDRIQDIGDHFGELGDIMYGAVEEFNNKPLMIMHLNTALGIVQEIETKLMEIIQFEEQHQDDSNNGSNDFSNVSYGSNESNGGRRKKRTMRKRRGHSKKSKQTHRKRTHRKRTHRKRTHRKRTHRK